MDNLNEKYKKHQAEVGERKRLQDIADAEKVRLRKQADLQRNRANVAYRQQQSRQHARNTKTDFVDLKSPYQELGLPKNATDDEILDVIKHIRSDKRPYFVGKNLSRDQELKYLTKLQDLIEQDRRYPLKSAASTGAGKKSCGGGVASTFASFFK